MIFGLIFLWALLLLVCALLEAVMRLTFWLCLLPFRLLLHWVRVNANRRA